MEYSRFFNGSIDDEREYNANDYAEYFVRGYSNGVYRENGLVTLRCTNTGLDMNTSISLGSAMIGGYLYLNKETPLVLTHDSAHATYGRFDRIVLRLDLNDNARYIKAFILKGIPSETPVAPALTRTALVYEISLAKILIPANSATIPQVNLTDERLNKSVCGVVSSQLDSQYLDLEDYIMEVIAFDEYNNPVTILYKTTSGINYIQTRLADMDENGKYLTMYVDYYLDDGETIGLSKKYSLTYNDNGQIIKREMQVI